MTVVMINDKPCTGRQLPKEIETHSQKAKVIDNSEKTFEEDFRQALTPEQFMLEMEQRIKKW
ncbi:MAG: hypothetical protein LBP72_02090 [Dysgonamonadaceae bacterium]|jgi:hypothetical protein|nr:hypothetical protein [Dysgonamonadaceae bacterium]